MKVILFFSALYTSIALFSQAPDGEIVDEKIALSNEGEFIIKSDKEVLKLVNDRTKTDCFKPNPKNQPTKRNTIEDLCNAHRELPGFKIQIFYTKNPDEAKKIRLKFKKEFPQLSHYIEYNQPDWKIIVGEYFSKETASTDFEKIKKVFPASFILERPVSCKRAK